ncbi:MAG: cell division septation protein DedD [Cyclobacteriaceae bacterium]|jgi:cell division septation protein DedD
MADDKNKDLDPDEEQNDSFQDDDDFGLPDLEYDELEDDDFEDEFDSPAFEDSDDSEETSLEITEEELSDDAFDIDDNSLDTDIKATEDELSGDDFGDLSSEMDDVDLSDEELQRELEELESEDMDFGDGPEEGSTSDPSFYEEETFEDFSDDNELDSVFGADDESDDTIGGFSPEEAKKGPMVDQSAKKKAASQYAATSYDTKSSDKGNFTKIVIFGTIIILVVASALWFAYSSNDKSREVAKVEQPKSITPKPKPAAVAPMKEEPKRQEPAKVMATPVAAGVVTSLEQRSGKAYIIIASFIDGDLAMDHANDLAGDGKSPYVIAPFNNGMYYRVAIAEFNNFADATSNLGSYKEEFGADIWTLRY